MKTRTIYYLEKPIYLSDEKEMEGYITLVYTTTKVFLEALILLKKTPAKGINIYANGEMALWEIFKKSFKIILAAGGIVTNEEGKKLFIKRLEHWDLPKGKLEKGETLSIAAVREVQEETGILINQLKKKITNTYHIYETRGGSHILKKVGWYEMFSIDKKTPTPQKEEGIEEVRWFTDKEVMDILDKTYKNISLLLNKYYKKEDSNISSK